MKFILKLKTGEVYTVFGAFGASPEAREVMFFSNPDHAFRFAEVAKLPSEVQIDIYNG